MYEIYANQLNTLAPEQKAEIMQTAFWNAFSWMKSVAFLFTFHWSLFLKVK